MIGIKDGDVAAMVKTASLTSSSASADHQAGGAQDKLPDSPSTAEPPLTARNQRSNCCWLKQLQIADSLLTCSGLVCVLVGYIFASSAPGNLRLCQVNGAGPTLRQVLAHCPGRQLVQRVPRRSTRPARDVRKQVGDASLLGHLGLARASPTRASDCGHGANVPRRRRAGAAPRRLDDLPGCDGSLHF